MTLRLFRLLAVFCLAVPVSLAQEKPKDEPKKDPPKKVVLADPKDVKDDADFAVQGEYVGEEGEGKNKTAVGIQVFATGGGKFEVRFYQGGLPGEGWKEDGVVLAKATRTEKGADISVKGQVTATIAGGVITPVEGRKPGMWKKVERKSPTGGAKPPEGAVVLFGKEGDEKNWTGGKLVELSDGKFLNNGIKSKQAFGAYSAHIEFRLPWMPESTGQGRGNSGVYLQDRFELQVLDSFGQTGENNECGGFYTLHKPKVNMCLPPLVWQTYDIEFTPAEVEGKKITKPAWATVKHNGVVIHDDVELPKRTDGADESGNPGVIQFQNHGDPVVYRNVWVMEKK